MLSTVWSSVPQTGCHDTLGCRVNFFGCREISRILIKRSRFINFNSRGCRKSSFQVSMMSRGNKVCGTLVWRHSNIFLIHKISFQTAKPIKCHAQSSKSTPNFYCHLLRLVASLKLTGKNSKLNFWRKGEEKAFFFHFSRILPDSTKKKAKEDKKKLLPEEKPW